MLYLTFSVCVFALPFSFSIRNMEELQPERIAFQMTFLRSKFNSCDFPDTDLPQRKSMKQFIM